MLKKHFLRPNKVEFKDLKLLNVFSGPKGNAKQLQEKAFAVKILE